MKNPTHIFLVGLFLVMVLAPLQVATAQDAGANIRITQVDNSKFPQVTLYVSVTDASGEPMGVNPNQLQISENSKVIKPDQISGSGEIGPLTTLLVMDVSGSMNNAGKLSAAKEAALAYVHQMRPGDQAGLLAFNTKVTYVLTITSDHVALSQAIKSLKAKNDTAMFDALVQADQILQNYPGRKAIIVLTDGMDNQSKQTSTQVIQAIGTSGLSISTIGLGNPDGAGPYFGLDESTLKSLAEKAGGVYSQANNASDLSNLFQLYGRALQSEYRITYSSPSTLRDGLGRTLTVSLNGTALVKTSYNPGGILPEVSSRASWSIFLIFLAILGLLIFVPWVVSQFPVRKSTSMNPVPAPVLKSRIKLK